MRLILGVDGGQTSTAALLATSEGEIVGVGAGGEANHIHEPGGMERMERSLRDAVSGAFAHAGISPLAVESACFGMTGGAEHVPPVAAKFLAARTLTAYHDVVTALAGASLAQAGVVVIAGTGAIAYGRADDGREAKADGWGYLMGDAGSAYDIGFQALPASPIR
jgi:N-acetylglucosamine kinase-like BadF-type ATPase